MTTEPAINPEANTGDIDVEMTVGEAVTLETAQHAAANPPAATPTVAESSPVFRPLTANDLGGTQRNDIDTILDIPVQLTMELGCTKVPIKGLLRLAQGSVAELNALAGGPMDVLVNSYLVARGEMVVVNEKFGIRLTDIIMPSERIRKLDR